MTATSTESATGRSSARHAAVDYCVVIPTVGRANLSPLVAAVDASIGPVPCAIVVVDDRPTPDAPLDLPPTRSELRVVRSGGRGPAAARNAGWRACESEWIAFLDDDVMPPADWARCLARDIADLPADVGASQSRIRVPIDPSRPPTDDERRTASLADARWITADMAYRRTVLEHVGGFDERFPRAYREDSDLALRAIDAGYSIVDGERVTDHPPAAGSFFASVRAQRGNRDNALMRSKFGPQWRSRAGEGRGRMKHHLIATGAALASILAFATGRRTSGAVMAGVWTASTVDFTVRRTIGGPRTPREIAAMAVTSAVIPPVAVVHRLRGEFDVRLGHRARVPVAAVLFDRDDTLIVDVPYLGDPSGVEPVRDARAVLDALRTQGIRVGVVSNQSGVAKGLIDIDQLHAVNQRVTDLLGPFDTWQYCVHDADDACRCRKPLPGMIVDAAAELGVSTAACVMIGDTGADVDAALAAGARAVLVPTARTKPDEVVRARLDASVAYSLVEAVDIALGRVR